MSGDDAVQTIRACDYAMQRQGEAVPTDETSGGAWR